MVVSTTERPARTARSSERPRDAIGEVAHELEPYLGAIIARSVVGSAARRCGCTASTMSAAGISPRLVDEILRGLSVYVRDHVTLTACQRVLGDAQRNIQPARPSEFKVPIASEHDVVEARSRARELAQIIGFGHTDQIRIATVVSEVARNIYAYAGKGAVSGGPKTSPRSGVWIRAVDEGPGIRDLEAVMSGSYQSRTGMGLGLNACRRMMDEFHVVTAHGRGTIVTMEKYV